MAVPAFSFAHNSDSHRATSAEPSVGVLLPRDSPFPPVCDSSSFLALTGGSALVKGHS